MRSNSRMILPTSVFVILIFTLSQLQLTAFAQSAEGSKQTTEVKAPKIDLSDKALDKIVRSTSQRQSYFLPPQSDRPADTSKTPHKSNKKKWILIALALGGAAVTTAVVLQKDEKPETQTITAGTLTIGQPQ